MLVKCSYDLLTPTPSEAYMFISLFCLSFSFNFDSNNKNHNAINYSSLMIGETAKLQAYIVLLYIAEPLL